MYPRKSSGSSNSAALPFALPLASLLFSVAVSSVLSRRRMNGLGLVLMNTSPGVEGLGDVGTVASARPKSFPGDIETLDISVRFDIVLLFTILRSNFDLFCENTTVENSDLIERRVMRDRFTVEVDTLQLRERDSRLRHCPLLVPVPVPVPVLPCDVVGHSHERTRSVGLVTLERVVSCSEMAVLLRRDLYRWKTPTSSRRTC